MDPYRKGSREIPELRNVPVLKRKKVFLYTKTLLGAYICYVTRYITSSNLASLWADIYCVLCYEYIISLDQIWPIETHTLTVKVLLSNNRDLTKLGRERRRERHKTIDLITKYNDFTLECNHLAAFPSSSFVNRTRKAQFCGFQRTWTTKHESFQSPCGFKIKISNFLCLHSLKQN